MLQIGPPKLKDHKICIPYLSLAGTLEALNSESSTYKSLSSNSEYCNTLHGTENEYLFLGKHNIINSIQFH